jgi:hypothetical protein
MVAPDFSLRSRISLSSSADVSGVEPRRRFIEEKKFRVQRHGSCYSGALAHPARDLRWHIVLEFIQIDEPELLLDDLLDLFGE